MKRDSVIHKKSLDLDSECTGLVTSGWWKKTGRECYSVESVRLFAPAEDPFVYRVHDSCIGDDSHQVCAQATV